MKALIAAIAIGAVAAPASAETNTIEVEYSDLNLESAKGQRALDRRIDQAARQVCDFETTTTGTRIRSQEARDCVVNAKSKAYQQVASLEGVQMKGG